MYDIYFQPEITLLTTEKLLLKYDSNRNELLMFKSETGTKLTPCNSEEFIDAIKTYRSNWYIVKFNICGYKMIDDDVKTIIRELIAYTKSVQMGNAKPNIRMEMIRKYIDDYGMRRRQID